MPQKVYVGNLPDNCPPDQLRDLFGGYGNIKELDVIKNFAFVHFDAQEDADRAVHDLDNTKMLGQVIKVRMSNSQKSREHDRRPHRRSGPNAPNKSNNGPRIPPLNGLGGILGAAPGAAPGLGDLGIFSAVNTLAAVAEEQKRAALAPDRERERERRREQPDPDVRVRREVVHTRDVPNASRLGIGDGYVIYERYYVDPSHPLLKGLPVPEYPRVTDTYAARDSYERDDYDNFRERSPVQSRRDYDYDRDSRDYSRDYYDRR